MDRGKNGRPHWENIRYIALRNQVLSEQGNICALCNRTRKHKIVLHVDHIKPVSKHPDLVWDKDNLQVLCEYCNRGKSNYFEDDWRSPIPSKLRRLMPAPKFVCEVFFVVWCLWIIWEKDGSAIMATL